MSSSNLRRGRLPSAGVAHGLAAIRSRAGQLGWRRIAVWTASLTGAAIAVAGTGQQLVSPAGRGGHEVGIDQAVAPQEDDDARSAANDPAPAAADGDAAATARGGTDPIPAGADPIPAGTSAAPGAVEGAGAEPGAPPTTTPVESGHGPGPDECGTWEVWFGAGAAGGGHECSFHASSPGGYEAWGDWTITIHRRGETITFSPERGFEPNAKRCSPTGTIQPGDFVEVYVGSTGSASAGKSFGKDCSA